MLELISRPDSRPESIERAEQRLDLVPHGDPASLPPGTIWENFELAVYHWDKIRTTIENERYSQAAARRASDKLTLEADLLKQFQVSRPPLCEGNLISGSPPHNEN